MFETTTDMTDTSPTSPPSPPKSDSTNVSVQTIIQLYDQKANEPASAAKPSTPPKQNYVRSRSFSDQHGGAPENHLYNTPTFPKSQDVEVFSTVPIVVNTQKKKHNSDGKTGSAANSNNNNASASSSITLITAAEEDQSPDDRRSFSICIWLAVVQLLLSVSLTALGVLMLTRGASLAHTGFGLWSGGVCGIAGALGVINVAKARTGFLAMSLICVASSTLAIAFSGIGLVRDINLNASPSIMFAASGLLAALSLHFIASVLSVYYLALRQCSKSAAKSHQLVDNVICSTNSNHAYLSHQRIEEYFKSLPKDAPTHTAAHKQMLTAKAASEMQYGAANGGNGREKKVWLGANGKPNFATQLSHPAGGRPLILIPAGLSANMPPMYRPTPPMIFPPHLAPPGMMAYHHHPPPPGSYAPSTMVRGPPGVGPMNPASAAAAAASQMYVTDKRMRKLAKEKRARRTRRKSESDKIAVAADQQSRAAFTYTGLDRAIADSFLEHQEKQNHSSMDCTSESGKCVDVAM